MSVGITDQAMGYMADLISSPFESATGTLGAGLTSGICRIYYDKTTKTVRICLSGANSSNISTSAVLFNIPSKYRPSSTLYGNIIVGLSSAVTAGDMIIESNGNIRQGATTSGRCVFGYIEYQL